MTHTINTNGIKKTMNNEENVQDDDNLVKKTMRNNKKTMYQQIKYIYECCVIFSSLLPIYIKKNLLKTNETSSVYRTCSIR